MYYSAKFDFELMSWNLKPVIPNLLELPCHSTKRNCKIPSSLISLFHSMNTLWPACSHGKKCSVC
uniref:Uncharacterized protein n=1 Tax=Arundo donax TaxID=35708 RepID=A0A0A8ZDQ4_ARUDO